MKILVFATTFGADLWSFTHYLDQKPEVELQIYLKNPEAFKQEGINKIFPLQAPFIEKKWYHYFLAGINFQPDVTIMDNSVPLHAFSENGFMLWHGFGWKGPNDEKELRVMHNSVKLCWGSAKKPNRNFRWQCFGRWDKKHRSEVSGIAAENCRVLGAASHDYLLKKLDLSLVQSFYPFDIINKKTVLIAPTWHYGEVFSHWGKDAVLFRKLFEHISSRDANIILRLHDSFRFDESYIDHLNQMVKEYPNIILKFKDQNPDNLLDMYISDILITNYSSIANLYYITKKPVVHIYPVKSAHESFLWRNHTFMGTKTKQIDSVSYIWKMPPEINGGLVANNFDELIKNVDISFSNPDCCVEQSTQFLNTYMSNTDGSVCEQIWREIQKLVEKT